jgi:hypothetical protein
MPSICVFCWLISQELLCPTSSTTDSTRKPQFVLLPVDQQMSIAYEGSVAAWLVSLSDGVLPVWLIEPPLLEIPPKGRCSVLNNNKIVGMTVSVMLNL